MSGEFEEEYLDVLQNIEAALASAYRQHSSMTDYDARAAVDALIRDYQAEMKGRPAPNVHMSNVARDAYEAARGVCEWRIGRGAFMDEQGRSCTSRSHCRSPSKK
ncbi:MAG: hypothetical protein RMN52_12115 [Anaerolineae bacterium]|nr:hypothetical protein [Candidatus Roseilinea sp.]MDW8450736.1 hypothetical protein [Anaerolineae bacterium]